MDPNAPLTIEQAAAEYASHLAQASRASYPLRQQLHRQIILCLGQLEHCRQVSIINRAFDQAEQDAGVSQTTWHGGLPPDLQDVRARVARLEALISPPVNLEELSDSELRRLSKQ